MFYIILESSWEMKTQRNKLDFVYVKFDFEWIVVKKYDIGQRL